MKEIKIRNVEIRYCPKGLPGILLSFHKEMEAFILSDEELEKVKKKSWGSGVTESAGPRV